MKDLSIILGLLSILVLMLVIMMHVLNKRVVKSNIQIQIILNDLYNKISQLSCNNKLPMCPKCGTNDVSQDEDGQYTCNVCED